MVSLRSIKREPDESRDILSSARSGALLTVARDGYLTDELALLLTAPDRRVARVMTTLDTIAERTAALDSAYTLQGDVMLQRVG